MILDVPQSVIAAVDTMKSTSTVEGSLIRVFLGDPVKDDKFGMLSLVGFLIF